MRIRNRTIPVVTVAVVLGIFGLATMTVDERYVAAPGIACIVMFLWLWMTLWDRDHHIPFFDVGVFCAMATLVYTIYPLVNYWAGGLHFGFTSDSRLQSFSILPAELGFFHLRHVLYLFSFVVVYSLSRGRGAIEVGNVTNADSSTRVVIVYVFLILTGFFFFLQLLTGFKLNFSYNPEAVSRYLTSLTELPLLVVQVSVKLHGLLFVFKLAFLFIIVSRSSQKKWFAILLIWITAEIIQTFALKGARTQLVLFVISTALIYHRVIKPLSMRFLITSGILFFLFFNFLGFYRAYFDLNSLLVDFSSAEAGFFQRSNEFQSLLGTAYHVLQLKLNGVDLPWYLYINDIINILPPQQIFPFEKISASEWYLRQLGISGSGVGYMWGVISQSVVGWDWLELALRGAILGYILALFHRWFLKHQSGFLENMFYTYMCLTVYYTFRDTTFSILSFFVWRIVPFYIILRIGSTILSRKRGTQAGHRLTAPLRNIKFGSLPSLRPEYDIDNR